MPAPAAPDAARDLDAAVRIDRPYLLVVNIPHYVDGAGDVHLERAWHRDVLEHQRYLPQLRIASPRRSMNDARGEDLVRWEGPRETFIALPTQESLVGAALSLPQTLRALHSAVSSAEIVHSGVAGWPYPLGWIASGLARLRRRALLVVVESAPWRLDGAPTSWRASVRSRVYESVAGRICRAADLALFTQPSYRDVMHPRGRGPAYVTPATWVRDEDMLDDAGADAAWRAKQDGPARILFAGRLVAEKGVDVLLDALGRIDIAGGNVHVDIIGAGERQGAIDAAAARFQRVKLRRLDPVPYGAAFFALVDRYHALVVPTLSDEQPRILFDAAARAVSVIASATEGMKPYVVDGETGLLAEPGNVSALVGALMGPGSDVSALELLGKNALRHARGATHTAMHARRSQLIAAHLAPSRS